MKPFQPSNSTEGEMFMERNCYKCKKETDCELILAAMVFNIGDKEYPEEFQAESVIDPNTWICTAKESI